MKKLKTLTILFDNEISAHEVPCFRGAIASSVDENNILFHNHDGDKLRYSYPLIQYKSIHGKAAIVCVGDGVLSISDLFSIQERSIVIGDRVVALKVDMIMPENFIIQCWEQPFRYHIRNWIPLNSINYTAYNAIESAVERIAFLEKLLTGNILSFGKGVEIQFDKKVECRILGIPSCRVVTYKNVKMMAFSVDFSCNVSLPPYIGLGKGVSHGHGTVTKSRTNKKEEQ